GICDQRYRAQWSICAAKILSRACLTWVIRVAPTGSKASQNVLYAFNGDRICASQRTDTMCHVWTAPSWQGESSRRVAGRCSHVFGAVHMTAGHNALRGSGPGQKPAFDN